MCPCGAYSETLCSARGQVQLHGRNLIAAQAAPRRRRSICAMWHSELYVHTGCSQTYQTDHMIWSRSPWRLAAMPSTMSCL